MEIITILIVLSPNPILILSITIMTKSLELSYMFHQEEKKIQKMHTKLIESINQASEKENHSNIY